MTPDVTAQLILDHTADTSQFGHMRCRYIESTLKNFSFAHRKMAFVSGPRQCGKTTLGKMLLKDRGIGAFFNWDETEFRRLWTKSPKSAVWHQEVSIMGAMRCVPSGTLRK